MVQDLFGQGADQRLAAELAGVLFMDAGDDLLNVERFSCLGENGLDQGDTGLGWGRGQGTLRGGAA